MPTDHDSPQLDPRFRRRARELLIQLFPRPGEARVVATDAELRTERIDFDGAAIEVWDEVIEQALNAGLVVSLLHSAQLHASDAANQSRIAELAKAHGLILPPPSIPLPPLPSRSSRPPTPPPLWLKFTLWLIVALMLVLIGVTVWDRTRPDAVPQNDASVFPPRPADAAMDVGVNQPPPRSVDVPSPTIDARADRPPPVDRRPPRDHAPPPPAPPRCRLINGVFQCYGGRR